MHCQVCHCILDCAKQIYSLKVTITLYNVHSLGYFRVEYFGNWDLFPSSAISFHTQLGFFKTKPGRCNKCKILVDFNTQFSSEALQVTFVMPNLVCFASLKGKKCRLTRPKCCLCVWACLIFQLLKQLIFKKLGTKDVLLENITMPYLKVS